MALIVSPTSWTDCSRFCAVTTISSMSAAAGRHRKRRVRIGKAAASSFFKVADLRLVLVPDPAWIPAGAKHTGASYPPHHPIGWAGYCVNVAPTLRFLRDLGARHPYQALSTRQPGAADRAGPADGAPSPPPRLRPHPGGRPRRLRQDHAARPVVRAAAAIRRALLLVLARSPGQPAPAF